MILALISIIADLLAIVIVSGLLWSEYHTPKQAPSPTPAADLRVALEELITVLRAMEPVVRRYPWGTA